MEVKEVKTVRLNLKEIKRIANSEEREMLWCLPDFEWWVDGERYYLDLGDVENETIQRIFSEFAIYLHKDGSVDAHSGNRWESIAESWECIPPSDKEWKFFVEHFQAVE